MPDLTAWLVENLERGVPLSRLADELERRGLTIGAIAAAIDPLLDRLRRREALLAIQSELASLVPREVRRVANLSAEAFLREHYAAQQPVVVEARLAAHAWTFDDLAARFGSLVVQIQDRRDGDNYQRDFDRFCTQTTLGKLIERIAAEPTSNDYYLTAKNDLLRAPEAAPLLAALAPLPAWLLPATATDAALWIGPGGTITPLHHDWSNLAIAQLVGTKRVQLVPASAAPLVGNRESRFADRDATELAHFTVELAPGDLLFVPVGWFHQVRALEPSISATLSRFPWPNRYAWSTDVTR